MKHLIKLNYRINQLINYLCLTKNILKITNKRPNTGIHSQLSVLIPTFGILYLITYV